MRAVFFSSTPIHIQPFFLIHRVQHCLVRATNSADHSNEFFTVFQIFPTGGKLNQITYSHLKPLDMLRLSLGTDSLRCQGMPWPPTVFPTGLLRASVNL